MALYVVREGEGEQEAIPVLVERIRRQHALELPSHSPERHSWKKLILNEQQVVGVCELARGTPNCEALLLTRDADKDQIGPDCPRFKAPEAAVWVRSLGLPFPVALVLFYKEFETLFLAGADGMAGQEIRDRRGLPLATIPSRVASHPAPESERDAKRWVRSNLVGGYKPKLLQPSLTRLIDPEVMDASGLSSYRRLVSALRFLADNQGVRGAVYPPPSGGR
ncbi:MAG: hypothetical protein ACR2MO_08415 [Acidimicrobiales bacterium]